MRRYKSLFLLSFILLVIVLTGNTYMAGYADRTSQRNIHSLQVYTTLPAETAAVLAKEYEKMNNVRISFVQMNSSELLDRYKNRELAENADMVLADKETLLKLSDSGAFQKYTSERTDVVGKGFKDESGKWTGVWYDPIVFCANRDYLQGKLNMPLSWDELVYRSDARIGITDFLAADAAANLLYTLVAEYDEAKALEWMRQLQPRIVQYSKYLASPVRMAGMGEVDVAIAVQSETIRYRNEGFPISIIYPKEGTAYQLIGIGILKGTKQKELAHNFVDWLLQDDVQICLQKNKFYFVPTNQGTIAYKVYTGKNLKLFENYSELDSRQKHDVLDRWVKNVRLK